MKILAFHVTKIKWQLFYQIGLEMIQNSPKRYKTGAKQTKTRYNSYPGLCMGIVMHCDDMVCWLLRLLSAVNKPRRQAKGQAIGGASLRFIWMTKRERLHGSTQRVMTILCVFCRRSWPLCLRCCSSSRMPWFSMMNWMPFSLSMSSTLEREVQ